MARDQEYSQPDGRRRHDGRGRVADLPGDGRLRGVLDGAGGRTSRRTTWRPGPGRTACAHSEKPDCAAPGCAVGCGRGRRRTATACAHLRGGRAARRHSGSNQRPPKVLITVSSGAMTSPQPGMPRRQMPRRWPSPWSSARAANSATCGHVGCAGIWMPACSNRSLAVHEERRLAVERHRVHVALVRQRLAHRRDEVARRRSPAVRVDVGLQVGRASRSAPTAASRSSRS